MRILYDKSWFRFWHAHMEIDIFRPVCLYCLNNLKWTETKKDICKKCQLLDIEEEVNKWDL